MNLRSGVVTGLIVLGSSVVCMNAAMAQQSGSPQTVSAYDYIGLQLNDHDQGDDSLSVHGSYSFQNPFLSTATIVISIPITLVVIAMLMASALVAIGGSRTALAMVYGLMYKAV